jgi:hypothetical protein
MPRIFGLSISTVYRNIMLTALVALAAVIAAELAPGRNRQQTTQPNRDEQLLATRVAEFSVHGVPLPQAVELLSKKTGVPIRAEWGPLKEYRDKTVTVDISDERLDEVIAAIFDTRRVNPDGLRDFVDFDIVNGVLVISSMKGLAQSRLVWRLYDVRDLVADDYWGYPGHTGEVLAAKWKDQQALLAFAPSSSITPASPDVRDARLLDLALLIRQGAGMRNWEYTAGYGVILPAGHALVQPYGGRIAVLQTRYGHRKVEELLAHLRMPVQAK